MVTSKNLSKTLAAGILSGCAAFAYSQNRIEKTILFICEHGSAKSIVAAAHFNRIAKENDLEINVISRGTNPDEFVPTKINSLLIGDGFESHSEKPVKLTSQDIKTADYIVAFNPIPATFGKIKNLETWNIPSFEAGYPLARDSMRAKIEKIIQRIKTENQK